MFLLDILMRGNMENNDMNLYWDSWDSYHLRKEICPRPILSRSARCSIPSESSIPYHNNNDVLLPTSLILSNPLCIPSLPKQECGKYEEKNVFFKYLLCFVIFKGSCESIFNMTKFY